MARKRETAKPDASPAKANGVVVPKVGRRAFYVDDRQGRFLLCDPDVLLTHNCRLASKVGSQWIVGTCKTKHPERAKGVTVDFGGTPVGGFKRTQLARVVGVMQPLL
jgi:hypothetical protein